MKKFYIDVYFTAVVHTEIEAENVEEANRIAKEESLDKPVEFISMDRTKITKIVDIKD